MFGTLSRKKQGQSINDAVVRYEASVKSNLVFSLPFEATNHLHPKSREGFVSAVNAACKRIGKELMLMRQVQLLDGAILAPRKSGSVWLPEIISTSNEHNVLVPLEKIIDQGHVKDFIALLQAIIAREGVYEVVPGLALFGDGGKLRVTASRRFIANLNNE